MWRARAGRSRRRGRRRRAIVGGSRSRRRCRAIARELLPAPRGAARPARAPPRRLPFEASAWRRALAERFCDETLPRPATLRALRRPLLAVWLRLTAALSRSLDATCSKGLRRLRRRDVDLLPRLQELPLPARPGPPEHQHQGADRPPAGRSPRDGARVQGPHTFGHAPQDEQRPERPRHDAAAPDDARRAHDPGPLRAVVGLRDAARSVAQRQHQDHLPAARRGDPPRRAARGVAGRRQRLPGPGLLDRRGRHLPEGRRRPLQGVAQDLLVRRRRRPRRRQRPRRQRPPDRQRQGQPVAEGAAARRGADVHRRPEADRGVLSDAHPGQAVQPLPRPHELEAVPLRQRGARQGRGQGQGQGRRRRQGRRAAAHVRVAEHDGRRLLR